MTQKPTFYITTAISYPNAPPHIGHAYELLATDALARFQRLDGSDVLFVTGTDEHGQKIQQTALKQGKTPQAFVDEMVPHFEEMARSIDASHDDFIRTSSQRHHRCVVELWKKMLENGDIYLSSYAGWYSVRDEAFWLEKELTERDGQKYAPSGAGVEWVEEKSYFFRLSAYQDRLLAHYEAHPDFIGPEERRNEILSFVRGGLQDLSISRTTFDWGIGVPDDPEHVLYVWVDALTNYLSATGYFEGEERARFWPADVHIIGKDIVRFHGVYWPAFLMSAGLPLPKRIFAHGFLFNKGQKMSKSLGNVVGPEELVEAYGTDAVRYFFLREVPFGQDGHYSHDAIVQRINADLANDFGNLAQRCLSMIAKHCEGRVPDLGDILPEDEELLDSARTLLPKMRALHKEQLLHRSLEALWRVIAEANRYFAAQAPWAERKTNPARMGTILYVTAETLRILAILAQPYLTKGAPRLLDLLAIPEEARTFADLEIPMALVPGTPLPAPVGLFPRYLEEETKTEG